MKKVIERALPFSQNYTVLNVSIVGIGSDWCQCANCGRDIANKATVMDSTVTQFVIGLDCLKTLVDANVVIKNTYLKSQDEINDACQVAAFVGFASGAQPLEKDWMYVTATKNGKTKQCYTSLVKNYAPAFLNSIHT